jgi:hypothetical protein
VTRYRLPEVLGSVECVFHSLGHEDGDWIVELVDTAPGLRLELPASSLTEVKPPPPEPPEGTAVLVSLPMTQTAYVRSTMELVDAWRLGGSRNFPAMRWNELLDSVATHNGTLTVLVPAPEPVTLPYEFRIDERDRDGDPTGTAVAMFVKVDPDCSRRVRFGFYNTISRTATPAQAREIGHAYLSAADAVEAQS